MKITAAMLQEFGVLGLTVEQVAGVAAVLERAGEDRRVKERDKKRRQREASRSVPGTAGDIAGHEGDNRGQTPLKEKSPAPPKENNPPTLSEATASSSEPRAGTTSEPMARLEFDSEFWPAYPHKVGKPRALDAYIAARRRATLPEILDGLSRYKSDKPPDRQWLNPATFLNQERWNDEPAPVDCRPRGVNGEPAHDAIFRALAEHASQGARGGGRAADADVRLLADGSGAPPSHGADWRATRAADPGPR